MEQLAIKYKITNIVRFGTQSLMSLGAKEWNNLPPNIRPETSFSKI